MSLCHIVRLDGYIQSSYLAVYPDKLMLLDGGCRPDVALVLGYIKNTLKRPISDLKVVVVTHMHPDHAGGALCHGGREAWRTRFSRTGSNDPPRSARSSAPDPQTWTCWRPSRLR